MFGNCRCLRRSPVECLARLAGQAGWWVTWVVRRAQRPTGVLCAELSMGGAARPSCLQIPPTFLGWLIPTTTPSSIAISICSSKFKLESRVCDESQNWKWKYLSQKSESFASTQAHVSNSMVTASCRWAKSTKTTTEILTTTEEQWMLNEITENILIWGQLVIHRFKMSALSSPDVSFSSQFGSSRHSNIKPQK